MAETKRKLGSSPEDIVKRGILAYMEHLKSIGEAIAGAADTYMIEHKISEEKDGCIADLPRNLSEAVKQFHNSLSNSSKRVFDMHFSEAAEKEEEYTPPKTTPEKSGEEKKSGTSTRRKSGEEKKPDS